MKIREFCRIRASGKNLYGFINAARQAFIPCMEQFCRHETFECVVPEKYVPRLSELAAAQGVELTAEKMPSLLGKLRRYRKRLGLAAGLLAAVGTLFYYSNIVTQIVVEGDVQEERILAVLAEEGITKGTWIGDIDYHRCEFALRHTLPEVAWAGIRRTGSRLVVHIFPATPQESEIVQERVPCNIISRCDAQITGVTIYDGRLVPMVGDGVHKGDLLVSGVLEDTYGSTAYHHAMGSVRGIYTKEVEFTEYFTIPQTETTGKIRHERYFYIFHLPIPLQLGGCRFDEYREWERTTPFSLLEHELPFGILHKTYAEQLTTITVQDAETAEAALEEQIFRYEKNILTDVDILDRQLTYSADADGITCLVTYTLEGEIGIQSDIFVK